MESHPLAAATKKLVDEHGVPRVLDVQRSIQVHKPELTGPLSYASYYILPPVGMSADAFLAWFESVPGFPEFRLTLVSILGLDTYHQPLISSDDFAKKYFHDNNARVIRVVGMSDHAIESMRVFIEALKRPDDVGLFPQHDDFAVSGYKGAERGGATELKLLFKPADHNHLMHLERLVNLHLDECNLGREIIVLRHPTREQPPELILASLAGASAGIVYLEELRLSLPSATPEEVAEAVETAKRAPSRPVVNTSLHSRFAPVQTPSRVLPPEELKKQAIASLAEILRVARFAAGAEVKLVYGGTTIEVKFPRTIDSLWLATSFREDKQIQEVAQASVGVRADPLFREGWTLLYHFDRSTGTLHVRAMDAGSEVPSGWKVVQS